MRMLVTSSWLAMSVASLLMAQHGGGHGGGSGGGGGFHSSAPASNFNSGYRTSITPQSYSGHLTLSTPTLTPGGLNRGGSGYRPVGPRPVRPPVRSGGYGYYGLGLYPFLGYGYYDNSFYGNNSYADQGAPQQQYVQPYEMGPDPNADYPPVPYAAMPPEQPMYPQQPMLPQQPMYPQAPAVTQSQAEPAPPITLILKSGQKIEVRNYAIMNGVFWDFTKQNSKRIPLAQVDVTASVKATDAAGGAFPEESFEANPR